MIEAVKSAIERLDKDEFTLQDLFSSQGSQIIAQTQSQAADPRKSIQWALIKLREAGIVKFVDFKGRYQVLK